MASNKPSQNFLRRTLDAFVVTRQRRAQRQVDNWLLTFSDDTLKQYGYDRNELARRAAGRPSH